jgi:hypothetical protein
MMVEIIDSKFEVCFASLPIGVFFMYASETTNKTLTYLKFSNVEAFEFENEKGPTCVIFKAGTPVKILPHKNVQVTIML